MNSPAKLLLSCACLISSGSLLADGITIDKVYDPYVQLLEKELEYRTLYQDHSGNSGIDSIRHKVGVGGSVSDHLFAEFYFIGEDPQGDSLELEGYEVELKWQLTEQGEYNNDWGLLFEFEREKDNDTREASTTLIGLHEWQNWVATANLSLIYEWGNDIENEWETAFAGQLRYRFSEKLEPGVEIYQAQNTQAIGPVATGLIRFGDRKKLNWEFGVIFGTGKETADTNWKFNLEYEF